MLPPAFAHRLRAFLCVAGFVVAPGVAMAQPAQDALCGSTLTESLVLEADVDCTRFTGVAITIGADDVVLDGAGYRLLAPDASRAVEIAGGVARATVRDLEVAGWCTGVGIYIDGGEGHVIDNVLATGRSVGVDARNTSDLTIRDVKADSAADAGLSLQGITLPLTLERLDLSDNLVGLRVSDFTGPYTFDTAAISDLSGSDTGVHFVSNVTDVTVADLTVDGDSVGINAYHTTNADLTFRDLDLSGRVGTGYGLYLRGDGHLVERVVADRRAHGVSVATSADLAIRHLSVAGATSNALSLNTITAPLELTDLSLVDSAVGLRLTTFDAPPGFAIGPYDPVAGSGAIATLEGSDTAIYATDVQDVTFHDLTLRGVDYGVRAESSTNANLTFERLDVSAPYRVGTGLYLRGPGHVVRDVTVELRATGVDAYLTSNLTVERLTAADSGTGLYVRNTTPPLTLSDLTLTHNGTALYLNIFPGDSAAPLAIGPWDDDTQQGVIRSLTGSNIGVRLANVQHARVHDLVLDGRGYGVHAGDVNNADLVFEDLDLSGPRGGDGLYLRGARHTVRHVTANHRRYGVWLADVDDLVMHDVTASHNTDSGLYWHTLTAAHTPPQIADLTLQHNATALRLYAWTLPFTFDPGLGLDLTGSSVGFHLSYTEDLTLDSLVLRHEGHGVYAYEGNQRLTLQNLDVSGYGRGTGVQLGWSTSPAYRHAGSGHRLINVTASHRSRGLYAIYSSDLEVTNFTAHHCRHGLLFTYLQPFGSTTYAPPTLQGLDLRHNDVALYLAYILDPMTLSPAIGLDTTGSRVGVEIAYSANVTFEDLTLANRGAGIYALTGNTDLTFRRLDLSGPGAGEGLRLGNARNGNFTHPNNARGGHTLTDIVADRRATGVAIHGADGVAITNLRSHDSTTGLSLSAAATAPALSRLDLQGNNTALSLSYIPGTAAAPFVLSPWDPDTETGAIASLADAGISLTILASTHVHLRDLVLDGDGYGLNAASTANASFRLDNVDASGRGVGEGVRLYGDDHVLSSVDASYRAYGLYLRYLTNPSLSAVRAHGVTATAIYIRTATHPLTFAGLDLVDNATGLYLQELSGAGSLHLDAATFTALDRNVSAAITLIDAAGTTVDDVALDLTPSGTTYQNAVPASDPLCGTTLDEDLVLTADLDCSGTTGTVLTVGADDLVIDGAGHRVIAPRATRVIYAANRSGLTLRDLDVSGARVVGTGVDLVGGEANAVLDVRADRRAIGVRAEGNTGLVVRDLRAESTSTQGLYLLAPVLPLTLDALALTGNAGAGLRIDGLDGRDPITDLPFDLGPAELLDISANATSIQLGADTRAVRVHDLALDGRDYGLHAAHATVEDLVLEDLDLTPRRASSSANYGADVHGRGHTLRRLTARDRYTGVRVAGGDGLTLEGLDLTRARYAGLYLDNVASPLSLANLRLGDNVRGLRVEGTQGVSGQPIVIAPWDPLTQTGAIADLAGSWTAIELLTSSHLHLRDLALEDGHGAYAIDAGSSGNADLTFSDLTVASPGGTGTGLRVAGTGHRVERLLSYGSATGLYLLNASDVTVEDVTVRDAYSYGLYLGNVAVPLTLRDLELVGNGVGIYITGFPGADPPYVIEPYSELAGEGAIRTLEHSVTAIQLLNTQDVHLRDLTLRGHTAGVHADHTVNARLRFSDLDLSHQSGTGLITNGPDHTIERVTAIGRATNLRVNEADGVTLTDLTATHGDYGVILVGLDPGETPPTLSGLSLRDNDQALYVHSFHQPFTIDEQLGLDLAGSNTGIAVASSSNLTVRDLTLDHPDEAILLVNASASSRFEDLVLNGHGAGDGLTVRGDAHVISNVTARRWDAALYGVTASDLTVTNVTANRSNNGLELYNLNDTGVGPTLSGLDLRDNNIGLHLYSWRAPTVVDATTGLDVSGSRYGVRLYWNTANVTVRDLALSNPVYGLEASTSTNASFVLEDLDLSGPRGTGLRLGGSGHAVADVVVHGRQTGVDILGATSSTVTRVTASRASSAALHLQNQTDPATATVLTDLTLSDSAIGLRVTNIQGPATFDGSLLSDVGGNRSALQLDSTVREVTVADLRASGPGTGVSIHHAGWGQLNQGDNLIRDVDVTGACRGVGVFVAGEDNRVEGVTAARRGTGIQVGAGDRLTIAESVMGANTTGLTVGGPSYIVNTTVLANAANTATRFRVGTQSYMSVGQTLRVEMPGGFEERVVQALASHFVTFTQPLSAVPEPGATVRALNFGEPRVTVEASDICANGTGATTAAHPTVATGNYWRASDGPAHADNPTGTGDGVTATNITYEPWVDVPSDKDNPYCNQMPVADAGPDQEVCEGDVVSLDASASYDPDVEPLDFTWSQLAGPAATLSGADQVVAQFTAPTPPVGEDVHTLTFQVRADDGHLYDRDLIDVSVLRGNSFPAAAPGAAQAVAEGGAVALDGSASSDPEAQPMSYLWEQVSGPAGGLIGADTATPTFTAPLLDVGGGPVSEEVVLRLTVTDVPLPEHCGGPRSHSATVAITVDNVNHGPTADAGADQQALEAVTVQLDGAASADPDGDALSFTWVQLSGATVTLTGADTATPTFTSPTQPAAGAEVLVFRLTVADGFGGVDTDDVIVTVEVDGCPDDPDKMEPGVCGCGASDVDSDGDGTPDCFDDCPDDPDKLEPGVCGCGVSDVDSDGDGVPDCDDGCPADPDKVALGVCGCGVADGDGDGDGVADCDDGCPADSGKVAAGVCGCGVSDVDSDGDGAADCDDGCPGDPGKVEPGQCGCGVPDTDTSGDGVADCLSDCSGLPDGTVMRQDVPCGAEACGDLLGVEYCEGGALVSSCDPAYASIPDDVCEEAPPVVAYAIAYDASGLPRGSIRCVQHHDGVIACDEDPTSPGTLRVYDELLCPGEAGR